VWKTWTEASRGPVSLVWTQGTLLAPGGLWKEGKLCCTQELKCPDVSPFHVSGGASQPPSSTPDKRQGRAVCLEPPGIPQCVSLLCPGC
jgi:hypothetical protein